MTFYIAKTYDQSYQCENGHNSYDKATHVDSENWICTLCHKALVISMRDLEGNDFTVERQRADAVKENDTLVYYTGRRLTAGQVFGSARATGKHNAGKWFLAVENFGGHPVEAHQFVNILRD